jgi:ankyrin repeat protein
MLIENGAEFNSKSDKNISPLHLAVFKGHVECAALLLEKGIENKIFVKINKKF